MNRINLERSNIETFLEMEATRLTISQLKYLNAKLRVEILKDAIEEYETLLRKQITKLIVAQYQLGIAEQDLERGNV